MSNVDEQLKSIPEGLTFLQKVKWIDKNFNQKQKAELLGKAYQLGSQAYENDPVAKKKIKMINKIIYNSEIK